MAKSAKTQSEENAKEPDYSFRELERAFKKNAKAIETIRELPSSPDLDAAIKKLETNNELIRKRAYKMIDEKFSN